MAEQFLRFMTVKHEQPDTRFGKFAIPTWHQGFVVKTIIWSTRVKPQTPKA